MQSTVEVTTSQQVHQSVYKTALSVINTPSMMMVHHISSMLAHWSKFIFVKSSGTTPDDHEIKENVQVQTVLFPMNMGAIHWIVAPYF